MMLTALMALNQAIYIRKHNKTKTSTKIRSERRGRKKHHEQNSERFTIEETKSEIKKNVLFMFDLLFVGAKFKEFFSFSYPKLCQQSIENCLPIFG